MLINVKKHLLKCSNCGANSTQINPLKKIIPGNQIKCLFCAKSKDKSEKSNSTKDLDDYPEQHKIRKEVKLLEDIVNQLKEEDNSKIEADALRAKIKDQEEEIQLLKDKLESQANYLESLKKEEEDGFKIPSDKVAKKYDKHYLLTSNNKILELTAENGEVIDAKERERIIEKKNFLYWIKGLQICASSNESTKKWFLELYDEEGQIDSKVVACYDEHDSFFKRGNTVYLSVYSTNEFYKIKVENRKLQIEKLCKTDGKVFSLLETKDSLTIGTAKGRIQIIKDGNAHTVGVLESNITGLHLKGSLLSAIDWGGRAIQIDLETGEKVRSIRVDGNYCNFIVEDRLVIRKGQKIVIYDWNGKYQQEINYSGDNFRQFHYTQNSTMITDAEGKIFAFGHKTFSLREYSKIKVPSLYHQY